MCVLTMRSERASRVCIVVLEEEEEDEHSSPPRPSPPHPSPLLHPKPSPDRKSHHAVCRRSQEDKVRLRDHLRCFGCLWISLTFLPGLEMHLACECFE